MFGHKWTLGLSLALLAASPLGARGQQAEAAGDAADEQKAAEGEQSPQSTRQLLDRIDALEQRLAEIEQARQAEELEKLRQAAETEAASAPDEPAELGEKTYITASRSLQMLNPEISVSGDFLAQLVIDEDAEAFYVGADDRSGLPFRALDMHIQSSLDPFSFTKIAIGFCPEGVSLEEAYMTWTGVVPDSRLSVGYMRQQFGVVNRWHEHDLDQTQYPLVLHEMLGEGGLTQAGVSLDWSTPPLWAHANELTVQVTNGSSDHLFAGEHYSVPTGLLHLKSYWDLNEDTYLELGLSGMFGTNNARGKPSEVTDDLLLDEDWRTTWLAGADLTLHWQPLKQARYRSLTWRSEGIWARREDPNGTVSGWGLYSYLQYQVDASWFIGARGDLVDPLWSDDRTLWQAVAYATFWQSEFVYLRLEASHGEPGPAGHDTRVVLQINWAAGPHKHEKY